MAVLEFCVSPPLSGLIVFMCEFVPSVISVSSMGGECELTVKNLKSSKGDTVNTNSELCDKLCLA